LFKLFKSLNSQVYSHHPCEKTRDKKSFLLNRAKYTDSDVAQEQL